MINPTNKKTKKTFGFLRFGSSIGFSFFSNIFLYGCASFNGPADGLGSIGKSASNQSNDSINDPAKDTVKDLVISGKAINGYLVNALVFQDVNNDGIYSSKEPISITDLNGGYKLENPQKGAVIVRPINSLSDVEKVNAKPALDKLGIINPDIITTYYKNNSGSNEIFNGRLELTNASTSDFNNVTPLTTLVSGLVSSGKMDFSTANEKIIKTFGSNPNIDYIALANSPNLNDQKIASELQKKSVAVSNLIASTISTYSSELNQVKLIEGLTNSLLEKIDKANLNENTKIEINDILASSQEIKDLLLSVALSNNLNINEQILNSIASTLSNKNNSYVNLEKIRLLFDSGISGVDQISSEYNFKLPKSIENFVDIKFSVAYSNVDDNNLTRQWLDSQSNLPIHQGFNRIFVKSQADITNSLFHMDIYYDDIAPGKPSPYYVTPFETFGSKFFQTENKIYVSDIKIQDNFLSLKDIDSSQLITQYQISNKKNEIEYNPTTEDSWLNFVNYSKSNLDNGRELSINIRQSDVAGNVSESLNYNFVHDNVKPDLIPIENIKFINDSGILKDDFYTNKIDIDQILNVELQNGDKGNVIVVYQWLKDTEQANVDNFSVNPEVPNQDGKYKLFIQQVDRANNYSIPTAIDVTLDTMSPIASDNLHLINVSNNSLALNYELSNNSFSQWMQYKIVNANKSELGIDIEDWINWNSKAISGTYDVFYRMVDRAGNASNEFYAGQSVLDFDLNPLVIDSNSVIDASNASEMLVNLKDQLIKNPIQNETYEVYKFINKFNSEISLVDLYLTTVDNLHNINSPIGFTLVEDSVQREAINTLVNSNQEIITAQINTPTFFALNSTHNDILGIGSILSDKVTNLSIGDVFVGIGGGDLSYIDNNFYISGISLLNTKEEEFIYDTFSANLNSINLSLLNKPIYKIYLEDSNNFDNGGIVLVQSDVVSYQSNGSSDYLQTKWNNKLNAWFIDLGAGNDDLYFGGDGIHVLGGVGSDKLSGGSGDDFLVAGPSGYSSQDLLNGYSGNDVLVGGDYLFKSNSSFNLKGGSGKDVIVIANGISSSEGGSGSDLFFISPIEGNQSQFNAKITDFDPGSDRLHFDGVNTINSGIFINQDNDSVTFDLKQIYNSVNLAYGSLLEITNIDTSYLTPEFIVNHWINFGADKGFEWTDLSIDSISNIL